MGSSAGRRDALCLDARRTDVRLRLAPAPNRDIASPTRPTVRMGRTARRGEHMAKANLRRANGHRRTRLRKRVLAAYSTCALCGLPVDKTLPPGDPGAAEVDEIVPVSLGGDPLAWANVQLTHRACNAKKSNTHFGPLPPPKAPTTSKAW